MEINELLKKAWAEVERANLPAPLNEIAFKEAIRLLTYGDERSPGTSGTAGTKSKPSGTATSGSSSERGSASPVAESGLPSISEDEFFQKLEREAGVSRDKLERVIHYDGKTPIINLPGRALGASQKQKQIAIAQVLPVVRQYGLGEAETSAAVVRQECERLRCADRNLSKYLADLDGIVYTGPSRRKALKVRRVDAFQRVVDQLLGASNGDSATE